MSQNTDFRRKRQAEIREALDRSKYERPADFQAMHFEKLDVPDDFVVVDTETTGVGRNDEVVELSVLDSNANELYHSFFKPETWIKPEATAASGLTNDMLANEPRFIDEWPKIYDAIGGRPIAGHNIGFDRRLIQQTLEKQVPGVSYQRLCDDMFSDQIDSMLIAKEQGVEYGQRNLGKICAAMGCEQEPNHRTSHDCLGVLNILQGFEQGKYPLPEKPHQMTMDEFQQFQEESKVEKHPILATVFYNEGDKKITMDKQAFSDLMQELPTNVFTGGGKTDRSFVSEDGHQIDISGYPVESSYEFFEGGVSIREGKVGEKSSLLYREDATCIGPYNFKSFHEGRFNSPDEVAEYLADKYKDQKFTETKKMLQPNYSEEHKVVWDDKKYASELARQEKFQSYSRYGEDDLKRLVWQDKGDVRMSNGQAGHMVTFAYACDQMKPGKDEIVPNPYLKTFKAKDGSVNHAMILPDDLYNRLKDVSGPGGGPWQGSFVSVLETKSMGKRTSVFPDLSNMALEAGVLKAPDEPFDLKKHDQFVKFSVKERAAARELPKVPEASVSQESQFEV